MSKKFQIAAKSFLLAFAMLCAMAVSSFAVQEVYASDYPIAENTTGIGGGNVYYITRDISVNGRLFVRSGETATIRLQNNKTLTAPKGIYVPQGTTLNIIGEGKLVATGQPYCAGIGAINKGRGGNININGKELVVEATGGTLSAGIGGAWDNGELADYSYSGNVEISAKKVTATGGTSGPGIGGGYGSNFKCNVTIKSGEVYATAGDSSTRGGAGIGGADRGSFEGTVNVLGGSLRAEGKAGAAGIGAGKNANASKGKVNISGGTVTAIGSNGGAGIGGGIEEGWPSYLGGEGATVSITGGTVIAQSEWCAIGHGKDDSIMGDLSIAPNMKVYAGNDGTNYERDGMPFTKAERVAACNYRKNARVEVCDHPGIVFETNDETHKGSCNYCNTSFKTEPHEMAEVPGSAAEATCRMRSRHPQGVPARGWRTTSRSPLCS